MAWKWLETSVKGLVVATRLVDLSHFQASVMCQIVVSPAMELVQDGSSMLFPPNASFGASSSQEITVIKKTFSLPKLSSFTLPFHKFNHVSLNLFWVRHGSCVQAFMCLLYSHKDKIWNA